MVRLSLFVRDRVRSGKFSRLPSPEKQKENTGTRREEMNKNPAHRERHYTLGEEIANSITHGLGVLLGIAALVILVVFAALHGTAWHVVSFAVFGSTLILAYLASTLYHSLHGRRSKKVFKILDHSAIFLLIAGTYTPFMLTNLRGPWGWSIFGIIWALAIAGIVMKSVFISRYRTLSIIIYVMMGWFCVIALRQLITEVPLLSLLFLILGGLAYTLGVIFYRWKSRIYMHAIWHVFVLTGSLLHFFAVMSLLEIF